MPSVEQDLPRDLFPRFGGRSWRRVQDLNPLLLDEPNELLLLQPAISKNCYKGPQNGPKVKTLSHRLGGDENEQHHDGYSESNHKNINHTFMVAPSRDLSSLIFLA